MFLASDWNVGLACGLWLYWCCLAGIAYHFVWKFMRNRLLIGLALSMLLTLQIASFVLQLSLEKYMWICGLFTRCLLFSCVALDVSYILYVKIQLTP